MNIIFMGTPEFALPALKCLLTSEYELLAVVTQPDRPFGRGREMKPPPVKEMALSYDVPVLQPKKANKDLDFISKIKEYAPDMVIVVAYGQILSEEILNIPKYGCINLHASLLPKYRGAAPINWVLVNGEKSTGVSVMKMDKGMDTGDVYAMESIDIFPDDTSITVHDKLSLLGAKLMLKMIGKIRQGTAGLTRQDDSLATKAPRLKKTDGLINWGSDAKSIERKVKGLLPWPVAFTNKSGFLIKIWDAKVFEGVLLSDEAKMPGQVVIENKNNLFICCGNGILEVLEIQAQNKKRMKALDFISGNHLKSGEILG